MAQIEKIDGMYKWDLNRMVDDCSKRIGDNGYFGSWHKIQIDGKQTMVYCDDRDALCITAINEWFDEIVVMGWSGDYRWNSDKPAIVRNGDKFNIVDCPKGGMYHCSKKMRLLCDEWFELVGDPKWKFDDELHTYCIMAKVQGEVVKITKEGSIVEGNPQELMAEVSHYSMDEILEKWIRAGKRCIYREGWAYRGAKSKVISNEDAERMLPQYHFGKGFYELSWTMDDGKVALEFNELSVLDME